MEMVPRLPERVRICGVDNTLELESRCKALIANASISPSKIPKVPPAAASDVPKLAVLKPPATVDPEARPSETPRSSVSPLVVSKMTA